MTGPKFAKRVRAMVVANAVREPIAKVQDGLPPRAKASSCEATITTAHVTHIGLCVQIGCKTTATVKRPIVIELREMGNYALTCAFSARGCGIPLLSYFPGSIKCRRTDVPFWPAPSRWPLFLLSQPWPNHQR